MAAPFTSVQFNTREEALSTDLNRVQELASRELQDHLWYEAQTQANYPGWAPANFADVQYGEPNFVNGSDLEATLNPSGTFDLIVGAGQAFFLDTSVTGDDSSYEVLRWIQTTVTLANPDGTNGRIDLIVATPGIQTTDVESRNILLDPVARTVAAANVPKTVNPVSAITVITGTPASTPVPPAVPAGSMALFEVLVPSAVGSSASFKPVRRTWRRVTFPLSTMHGIIRGCLPNWGLVDETTTSATLGLLAYQYNRLVIDGTVLQFGSNPLSGGVFQDTANNPLTVAAPATADMPYYLYLCGGRDLPQLTSGAPAAPVILIESLTAPDAFGFPSAALVTPRGSTQRALYIGVGFVVMNTTGRRKGCIYQGDWCYARSGQMAPDAPIGTRAVFNDGSTRSLPASALQSFTLAAQPGVSTRALIGAWYDNSSAPSGLVIGKPNGASIYTNLRLQVAVNSVPDSNEAVMDIQSGGLSYFPDGAFATGTLYIWARAYNMLVPRLSP